MSCTQKRRKIERKPWWKKENPPPVNKKTRVVAFFSCLSFSLFFLWREKGGRIGSVRGGDRNIGIVFIFIRTFLLSIELLQ